MASDTPDQDNTQAIEAFDRFLDVLRREFRSNPEFAYQAVKALGAEVVFEGKLASKLMNLTELVATKPEEVARAQLGALSPSDLKALGKQANLATNVDMSGKDKGALIEMLYVRAQDKISERRSSE